MEVKYLGPRWTQHWRNSLGYQLAGLGGNGDGEVQGTASWYKIEMFSGSQKSERLREPMPIELHMLLVEGGKSGLLDK